MGESSQLLRQWRLLQMFSSRRYGVTIAEMLEETEVSSRTLHRDLSLLKAAGFPLIEEKRDYGKKFWKLADKSGISQLNFTFEEVAAIYLGSRFMEAFAGTLFWKGSRSAFKKIRSAMNESTIEFLGKVANGIHLTQSSHNDYSFWAEIVDGLMVAIEDRQLCVITYQSLRTTEPVTLYDIHPYALIFHKGALYLIAWSLDHQERRTFKVDRISDVEVQTGLMKFSVPDDFDPVTHLENSFGIFAGDGEPQDVRVKFSSAVVRILKEKTFHPSQKLVLQRDGSAIAFFRLSTFEEFRSWILSFGKHAEVLEPDELVDSIVNEIQSMNSIYENQESRSE